jgi:DNA-binding PadR family transcriptional regulator
MPGSQGAAEPARFALLGLLIEGPRHGYDLARFFSPGSALADIVHLSPSHLYALLGRLERDGLIVGRREEVGPHPPRRVHELSEAGREAVLRWLDEPVDHPRDMRIDFPLKLYLARRLDPARAASLVERQRDLFLSYVSRLDREDVPASTDDNAAFIALMREGRLGRLRAALSWLDRCMEIEPGGRIEDTGASRDEPGFTVAET